MSDWLTTVAFSAITAAGIAAAASYQEEAKVQSADTKYNRDLRAAVFANNYFRPSVVWAHAAMQSLGSYSRRSQAPPWVHIPITCRNKHRVMLSWWMDVKGGGAKPRPVALILHGLGQNHTAKIIHSLAAHLARSGFIPVVYNRPGCHGTDDQLATPLPVNHGDTEEMADVVEHVYEFCEQQPVFAIGLSAGSNLLTKYMGERHHPVPIAGGVSVSNGYNLNKALTHLRQRPFYSRVLARLHRNTAYSQHAHQWASDARVNHEKILAATDPADIDRYLTCPLLGFETTEAYYDSIACEPYLPAVRAPLLLLNALDDPCVHPSLLPGKDVLKNNPNLVLATTSMGGHLGWTENVRGDTGWLERTCARYLKFVRSRLATDLDNQHVVPIPVSSQRAAAEEGTKGRKLNDGVRRRDEGRLWQEGAARGQDGDGRQVRRHSVHSKPCGVAQSPGQVHQDRVCDLAAESSRRCERSEWLGVRGSGAHCVCQGGCLCDSGVQEAARSGGGAATMLIASGSLSCGQGLELVARRVYEPQNFVRGVPAEVDDDDEESWVLDLFDTKRDAAGGDH